jgi:hypothetical protein
MNNMHRTELCEKMAQRARVKTKRGDRNFHWNAITKYRKIYDASISKAKKVIVFGCDPCE